MKEKLEKYFDKLWPVCRSITGNGLRESFKILQEIIPLQLTEVLTGTQVFDWTVPKEWNITDAYIVCPDGKKIADFKENNLHILNYSVPVETEIAYHELLPHLHTLPDLPEAIPYLTSYYKENWGFCLSHNEFLKLPEEGNYKVYINSTLEQGSLTYGDFLLKGETEEEILFSTYLCHPSMANNELSGPLVMAFLYQKINKLPRRRYTYRFIIAPETIGIIAYLAAKGLYIKENIKAGYVITCAGDDGVYTYKRSKENNADVNKIAEHVLKYSGKPYKVIDFAIGGSDERQYCSPGFNMPVGSLMRTKYQAYKEYHTSFDNKSFISFEAMNETIETYFSLVRAFELNDTYLNKIPFCEPQLSKRGLYTALGGQKQRTMALSKRLHLLSFADGKTSLLEIAERMNCNLLEFEETVYELKQAGLID